MSGTPWARSDVRSGELTETYQVANETITDLTEGTRRGALIPSIRPRSYVTNLGLRGAIFGGDSHGAIYFSLLSGPDPVQHEWFRRPDL